MTLAAGVRLGPYEILGPIGAGGMGEVYRGRDTRLGREVAVKVIQPEAQGIPDLLPRFQREAKAIAALNHPNILALHDIGNDSGVVYAVMELLEGETLRERLDVSGSLTPLKATGYASQIARGLAAAHERGIVHRDLKPENLFITHDGLVKILDFGLAQHEPGPSAELDTRATRFTTGPGLVLGTPGYMAPEQLVGQPATPRSDLFAFGVVVHEMLTGSHPFRRATPAETAGAILHEDPPPLSQSGLPPGIATIVERCLDRRAGDRPSSARDLALFFDAVGSQTGEVAAGRAAQGAGSLRRRLALISCGLLALLSGAMWIGGRFLVERTVKAAIDSDLMQAERIVRREQSDRLAALATAARFVASFPNLSALFATDAPTVHDFLVTYQQRLPEVPMLVAVAPGRVVIARTGELADGGSGWVDPLLARPGEPAVVQIGNRPFFGVAAGAEAAGTVFGYIVALSPVDRAFAAALREATQDEVVLLASDLTLASTLRAEQTPWRSLEEWRRIAGPPGAVVDVSIGGRRYAAREVGLSATPAAAVVVLKSRDEATAPFARLQNGVLVLGLISLAIAALGSYMIVRTI
ncbi:MAG TPA: serine/threonine-protein kinase [Vicinamibacterales bacterium]|nr:serine/threonine-protein kinase [Vicinamibacterales bacterium]